MTKLSRRSFLAKAGAVGGALALLPSGCGERRYAAPAGQRGEIDRLRSALEGDVVLSGDAAYDRLRRAESFNPRTDARPALIVRCKNRTDVERAVEFARSRELELAVRSGGNDVLGQSVCDGGLVVDLSPMKALHIDPRRRTAVCGSGLLTGEVNESAAKHGLAVPLGCHPGVGLGGLTLGGGLGWLLGLHGAACDNLLSAEVVTPDGSPLRASSSENPELFWGLRGGGGNFGIATALTFRMHPAARVFGGLLAFRAEQTRSFLRFYRDFMASAPDALVVELKLGAYGLPVLFAMVCYCGDLAAGERAVRPLRAFGPPLADAVGPVDYASLIDPPSLSFALRAFGLWGTLQAAASELSREAPYSHWKGGYASRLTDASIETIGDCVERAPPHWSIGIGHYMHGAVCRVPSSETCLPRECGGFSYFFHSSWSEPDRAEPSMHWVDRSWERMQPFASPPPHVNYLSEGGERAVAAMYGENYPRLVALKRRFDPENVFHRNRNIRPGAL